MSWMWCSCVVCVYWVGLSFSCFDVFCFLLFFFCVFCGVSGVCVVLGGVGGVVVCGVVWWL